MRRAQALRLSSSSEEGVEDGAVLRLADDGETLVTLEGTRVVLGRDASSRIPRFAEASGDYAPAETLPAAAEGGRRAQRKALVEATVGDDDHMNTRAEPLGPTGPSLEETLLQLRRSQLSASAETSPFADLASPRMLVLDDADVFPPPITPESVAVESPPVPSPAHEAAAAPVFKEALVRTGMVATLAYLAHRGIRPALVLPGTRPASRVRIEHRDDAGNILGPREAFKALSRRFHGTGRAGAKTMGDRRALRNELAAARPFASVPESVRPAEQPPASRNPRIFGML